ncbi:sterol desaturase/sphingolipid hydroxylase (fatty acid hydroxylase superfamily) [Planomicrobium stackebrandtii]|uniref:Sterol desaturase/sphingolipid hydroxylase (Fatty acid hydroxylase superfamily) n=1 Tax=Planomicrobium stackebrandtii TaxID=253160 RepID=A0ABU0GTA2_9BACL|nr:tryptophan-rich sensory protein [Planomicrobium stackebrandtii]MDQ0428576.1 sterol desaturase/sphingolipid hydroxylase (fatty acid hydroxylase superfamily) [Planomicrobium stackebrandtii]
MDRSTLKKTKVFTLLNLVFYFLTLGVNYLGSSGFFNGMGQKDISDKYMTLISPAPFTFSIWGVIYSLLLITLIYLFIKRQDKNISKLVLLVSPLFIASSLLNMGWIVAFSYEQLGVSTLLILGMLFSLLIIVERIYKNRFEFPSTLAGLSFTFYSSWVFIATIVNISLFLVQLEWNGFGLSDSIWTLVVLGLAIAFVLFYLSRFKNAAFPIPIAWAFYGIYSAYASGQLNPAMSTAIQGVLLAGIGIYLIAVVWRFIKNGNALFPRQTA